MDDEALRAIAHTKTRFHRERRKKTAQGKRPPPNTAAEEAIIAKKHAKCKRRRNRWLTYLDVSDCKNITNSGVKALRNVANLKVLKLGGCDRVREKALMKLIHTLGKLRDLDLRDLELADDAIGESGYFYGLSLTSMQCTWWNILRNYFPSTCCR